MAKAPRNTPEFVDTAGNEIDTVTPNVVTLDKPIKRAGQTIDKVTLIEPNAGTLRGVSLAAVAQSEVDALIKVLPPHDLSGAHHAGANRDEPARYAVAGREGDWFFVTGFGGVDFPPDLSTDDLMADIAVIFHWPPSELYSLSLTELITWREKALQRSGNHNE